MSTAAHTPGPWTVTQQRANHMAKVMKEGRQICSVDRRSLDARLKGEICEEANANAALIAASPDLYYALNALYATAANDGWPQRAEHMAVMEQARAALKRARE